jgi:tetratricopeptide (TPR) repeat protein
MQTIIAGLYGALMLQILILNGNKRRFAARGIEGKSPCGMEVYDMTNWNSTMAPPLEAQVLYRQALEMAGLGRYDEAVQVFRDVVTIAPRFTRALMEMGNCLAALGRYPEARAAYSRVLEIDPQAEEVSARRDRISKKDGNFRFEGQYLTVETHTIPGNGKGIRDYSRSADHNAVAGNQRQGAIISPVQAVYRPEHRYHGNTYGSPVR